MLLYTDISSLNLFTTIKNSIRNQMIFEKQVIYHACLYIIFIYTVTNSYTDYNYIILFYISF